MPHAVKMLKKATLLSPFKENTNLSEGTLPFQKPQSSG
jgi:hypothetical protein